MFQHTAARRRLLECIDHAIKDVRVSTHSRAEAAAKPMLVARLIKAVSTHSRAEAAATM